MPDLVAKAFETTASISSTRLSHDWSDTLAIRSAAVPGLDRLVSHAGRLAFRPTVITDVAADDPVVREEVFGPVVAVLEVPDLDAAIDHSDHKPDHVVVFQRPQVTAALVEPRDVDWETVTAAAAPAEVVPS